MTPEERESIINDAVEKTILMIPEIVGNLIMNHAAKIRANKAFYKKHPEFAKHKELVATVIEELDDSDPSQSLLDIIEKAVPKIERRIKLAGKLDTEKVEKPNLEIDNGVF